MNEKKRLGVLLKREVTPFYLSTSCSEIEEFGVDDLWVVEDMGWYGGISAATIALQATNRVRVGLGIIPVPYRNPAILAMELATLSSCYPGRLVAGVGHGVQEWVKAIGIQIGSPLSLLKETIIVLQTLLQGDTINMRGKELNMTNVALNHKPPMPPDILTGVIGPKSIELGINMTQGVILIEGSNPMEIRKLRKMSDRWIDHAGSNRHQIVVLLHMMVDNSPQISSEAQSVRREIAQFTNKALEDVHFAVGEVGFVVKCIVELFEAGADTVVLHQIGDNWLDQLRQTMPDIIGAL